MMILSGLLLSYAPPLANGEGKGKRHTFRIRQVEVPTVRTASGCVAGQKKAGPDGPAWQF
jgi:hypothetical protein